MLKKIIVRNIPSIVLLKDIKKPSLTHKIIHIQYYDKILSQDEVTCKNIFIDELTQMKITHYKFSNE